MILKERNTFSSNLGFILSAAGSAVGLGNIWRFPYLAAKDGGGLFLAVYIVLALTFGFTMLIAEVAIGRKTKQSCLTAYGKLNKKSGWIGVFGCVVPFLILPYYCIIGGWLLKYCVIFITGAGEAATADGYFGSFISGYAQPIVFDIIFLTATALVVYFGVEKGIEKFSKVLMPILLAAVVGIALFSLGLDDVDGRSGMDGFKIYVVPSIEGMGVKDIFFVVLDAMGQLFYSISVAMGIMVTYGSYLRDGDNLVKAVNRIELFDTLVAFLAGVMVIPAVYVFLGREGMSAAGPGLMFVALPKVFAQMGSTGMFVGAAFFVMALFAALTSSVSIMEAVVSSFMDRFGVSRAKAAAAEAFAALAIGILICLGYNALYFEIKLPNGTAAKLLDIFDYLSNNILMPIVEIGTCILVGWIISPEAIIKEATKNGEKFGRKALFVLMIKFVAPIMLVTLLLGALGVV
ncbi:MAG: sodium-dependent transporter [Firmicutes bacterium]|nr:sodium-dependent transporter [Bacillota bacterium]